MGKGYFRTSFGRPSWPSSLVQFQCFNCCTHRLGGCTDFPKVLGEAIWTQWLWNREGFIVMWGKRCELFVQSSGYQLRGADGLSSGVDHPVYFADVCYLPLTSNELEQRGMTSRGEGRAISGALA